MIDSLKYRFTLENDNLGNQVISEPIGWDDIKFNLIWSEKSHSKLFTLTTPLRFYGKTDSVDGGMDYVLRAIRSEGVDSEVRLKVETTFDEVVYIQEFTGTLTLPRWKQSIGRKLNYIECPIEETSKNQILKSRFDTKVDFASTESVDGISIIPLRTREINMHSLPILKQYEAKTELANDINNYSIPNTDAKFVYFGMGHEVVEVDELETFGIGNYIIEESPVSQLKANDNGLYEVNWNPKGDITVASNRDLDTFAVRWWYRKNDAEPVQLFNSSGDTSLKAITVDFSGDFSFSIDLLVGDELFIYGTMEVTPDKLIGDPEQTYLLKVNPESEISISSKTTADETTLTAPLIHEAFRFICDSIFSEDVTFYSDLLGNLSTQDIQYTENGCMSFMAVCNGRMIRRLESNFSMSFKDLSEALNCLIPIGYGIETINGKKVLRLEHVSYFYNQESLLVIDDIPEITISNDSKKYYNKIKSGYANWELEDVGGIKEPNSPREHNTVLKRTGSDYNIECKFITSGYIIETIRRLREEKTTDYKFDNNNFFISLNKSVNGSNFPEGLNIAAKDESFNQVTNIEDSENAYNLELLPEINLLRHGSLINTGLYSYPATKIRPVYFEGFNNYSFELSDTCFGNFNNQSFNARDSYDWNYAESLDVKPVFIPIIVEFEYPFDITMFRTLTDNETRDANGNLNRNKSITIKDFFGKEYEVFVIDIKDNPFEPNATWKCVLANTESIGVVIQEVPSWLDMNGAFVLDNLNNYIGD